MIRATTATERYSPIEAIIARLTSSSTFISFCRGLCPSQDDGSSQNGQGAGRIDRAKSKPFFQNEA